MGIFRQRHALVEVAAVGPEPVGLAQVDALHTLYGLSATGSAAPGDVRWGLNGSVETRNDGDLGALQGGGFVNLRTGAAKGTRTTSPPRALPSTSSAGQVQGLLGQLGL